MLIPRRARVCGHCRAAQEVAEEDDTVSEPAPLHKALLWAREQAAKTTQQTGHLLSQLGRSKQRA